MRSDYQEKKEQRIERYKELAGKAGQESTARYKQAEHIASFIPMGQPIMVGHHSEKRHRRDAAKIDNSMRASVEASKKADYYEEKALAAEQNTAISSDNPDSLELLRKKLEVMQGRQEFMKQANKLLRNTKMPEAEKVAKLVEMGAKEATAIEFLSPDQFGRLGFPQYKLTNNNANMGTVKKRIARLEILEKAENKEYEVGGIKVVENAEENRVQIYFPGKPEEAIRKNLKSYGFRWAPSNGCWQAYYSNRAKWVAQGIAKNQVA